MPRPSSVYAKLLHDRLEQHNVSVYLINTGWQGGPYGVGKRVSIPHTRAMVTAALDGTFDDMREDAFTTHPVFNVKVPKVCPDVPPSVLDPRSQWKDPRAYDAQAAKLACMFAENFRQFKGVDHLLSAGPRVPSAC